MSDPVTAAAIGGSATWLSNTVAGGLVTNALAALGYDIGKAGLIRLIRGADFDDNGLPANHNLRHASRDSLQAAMFFAVHGTAGMIDKRPPLIAAIVRHWQAGTLREQTLLTVRQTDAHRWLAGLKRAIARNFKDFDNRVRFDDTDAQLLLTGDLTAGLGAYIQNQFGQWADMHVEQGIRPAAFDEGLRVGWPVEDHGGRISFFKAYCLFFREELKKDTDAFRAFVGPMLAELSAKVDRIGESPRLDVDSLADTLLEKTIDEIDDVLGELHGFLVDEFGKLHDEHAEITTMVREVKDDVRVLVQRGVTAQRPALSLDKPVILRVDPEKRREWKKWLTCYQHIFPEPHEQDDPRTIEKWADAGFDPAERFPTLIAALKHDGATVGVAQLAIDVDASRVIWDYLAVTKAFREDRADAAKGFYEGLLRICEEELQKRERPPLSCIVMESEAFDASSIERWLDGGCSTPAPIAQIRNLRRCFLFARSGAYFLVSSEGIPLAHTTPDLLGQAHAEREGKYYLGLPELGTCFDKLGGRLPTPRDALQWLFEVTYIERYHGIFKDMAPHANRTRELLAAALWDVAITGAHFRKLTYFDQLWRRVRHDSYAWMQCRKINL